MPPILITNCSNRKTGSPSERLTPNDITEGLISDVCSAWIKKLKTPHSYETVGTIYKGRGAQEANKCAKVLKADHWVVSAGLGLVQTNEKAPLYDLTVSGSGETSIKNKVISNDFTLHRWWHEISKRHRPKRSISRLMDNTRSIVILGLSTNYFNMVSEDLSSLSDSKLQRLRIIGPTKSKIPERFHGFLLPYDYRLDGSNSPIRGTRSDFPQRAVHHFAQHIWKSSKSHKLDEHIRLVNESMNKLNHPVTLKRQKRTDDELINIIIEMWSKANGQSGRMLRILRDEKQVACEQSRFSKLFVIAKQRIG